MKTTYKLESLAAALTAVMGVDAPLQAEPPNEALCSYASTVLADKKADRIFLYNPDGVAQWIAEKYPDFLKQVTDVADLAVSFRTVMPSVTPVCFGTLYTGVSPAVHGIRSYTKPVIKTDSVFDALLRSGKKCAIVSTAGDSMSKIFLEREMDYYIFDTAEQVNAKACELIVADRYDLIAVYNGNYDSSMHKNGPESRQALGELRCNARTFGLFAALIAEHWQQHNTLLGFATDHGCHEIDGDCGSHGLDMDEDLLITHFYRIFPAVER